MTQGYTRNKEYDGSKKGRAESDGIKVYNDFLIDLGIPTLILVLPILALLAVALYPVTLTIFSLYTVLFVSRSVRRLTKKFTKHTIDPNAHKEEI